MFKYLRLKKYIRSIRNEYIKSKGNEGCIEFTVLTTGNELIIYPNNNCRKQLRLKY